MAKGKQKSRGKQKSNENDRDDPEPDQKANTSQNGNSGDKSEASDGSTNEGTSSEASGLFKNLNDKWSKLLEDFRFQVFLRLSYILLSTFGSISMIREHPTPIFRGWNILFIILFLLINAVLALATSNRELKLCWLFLRSFSTYHFFWAMIQLYPEHAIRVAIIATVASIYGYYSDFDRKAITALIASLVLVATDTPKLRKYVWKGEKSQDIQIGLGVLIISMLGGWRIYRWFALIGMYIANSALLMADFTPNVGQADLHQFWVASAMTPMTVLYHLVSKNGLPSYFGFIYLATMLILIRANVPNPGIKIVRTMLMCGLATLLELFAFGLGGRFVVFTIMTLVYLIWMA